MQHFETEVEIAAPAPVVYNQWLQVGEHGEYMDGVTDSGQVDHRRVYWSATFMGREIEWDIEIIEQDPYTLNRWRSTHGPYMEGTVTFTEENGKTRLRFMMDYAVEQLSSDVEAARKFMEERTKLNVLQFRDFIERRGRETGGWVDEVYPAPLR